MRVYATRGSRWCGVATTTNSCRGKRDAADPNIVVVVNRVREMAEAKNYGASKELMAPWRGPASRGRR